MGLLENHPFSSMIYVYIQMCMFDGDLPPRLSHDWLLEGVSMPLNGTYHSVNNANQWNIESVYRNILPDLIYHIQNSYVVPHMLHEVNHRSLLRNNSQRTWFHVVEL